MQRAIERRETSTRGAAVAWRVHWALTLGVVLGSSCQVDERPVDVVLAVTGTSYCDATQFIARCDGGLVATCEGGRIARAPCPEGQLCEQGACALGCLQGNVQCDGERGRSVCVDDAYVSTDGCTGESATCVEGRCLSCRPGEVLCSPGTISTCSPQGAWLPAEACPEATPTCAASLRRCSVCDPGKMRCSAGGDVERCDAAGGAWVLDASCSGEVCVPEIGDCGECSAGDVRACTDALGNCAAGQQRCGADSRWAPCSIAPASVDNCDPGGDADCDGTPNNPPGGCGCSANVSCGTSDVGACQLGTSICTGGQLGPCMGAIGPAPRNCRSNADNDCDGLPDDAVDSVCQCVPDAVEACDTHGSLDGVGVCQAGRRTCVASAGALSSSWGVCVGAVAPGATDCTSALDNDCNGVADRYDLACAPPDVVVTIEPRGNATFGVVRSSPAGLECRQPPCSASFPQGTSVTLTSTTVAQFRHGFAGWGGPCTGLEECSFVVSANVTVTAAFDQANVAFVTSETVNGNLGGRAGADAVCNRLASSGGLPGQYFAWLSTSTASSVDRLRGSRGWIRSDGLPLVDTLDDLPDYMFYPLRTDEQRRDVGEQQVLTASTGDGRLGPPFEAPCADFTSATASGVVDGGLTSAVGLLWSTFTQAGCGVQRHLYCLGTGRQVAIRPEPDDGRVAFISDAFLPAGGRAGADQFCQSQATRLRLSGTFKAVLATSTASAASQFDLNGLPWIGLDGVRIATTARAFFESASWDTVPKAEFPYGNSGVWVGGTSLTQPGTLANTCNDWRDTNGSVDAGASGMTGVNQFYRRYGAGPCATATSMVCLEQ